MQRSCQRCGKAFNAARSTAKFCSSSCRANESRSPGVTPLPASTPKAALAATRETLEAAGRDGSYLGALALVLAARVDETPGAGAATLAKELRAVMGEALEGVGPADAMDELRARRDAKRAAG